MDYRSKNHGKYLLMTHRQDNLFCTDCPAYSNKTDALTAPLKGTGLPHSNNQRRYQQ
jgi:hypothetical protein